MNKIYVYGILTLFLIAIIIAIIFFRKKSTSSNNNSKNLVWSGSCDTEPNVNCDLNNNCALFCNKELKKVFQNCSKAKSEKSGSIWNSYCIGDPIITPSALICPDGYTTTYKGEINDSSENLSESCNSSNGSCPQCVIKVNNTSLPIPPERLQCASLSYNTYNDEIAVCCELCTPPPSPSCSDNSPPIFTKNCNFISYNCDNDSCFINCDGATYETQACSKLETNCVNGNCVACCLEEAVKPSCPENQTPIEAPNDCSNINSTCKDGFCTASCDGIPIQGVSDTCFKNISTICNDAGCVVCCN